MKSVFEEARRDLLLAALHDIGFVTMIAPGAGAVALAHAPLEILPGSPDRVRLHLARANPLLLALGVSPRLSLSAMGAQGFISPSWYATKQEHGAVIPTWD